MSSPTAYANSVQIQVSLFDFRLAFGQMAALASGSDREPLSVDNFFSVLLSPQQAKALSRLLAENVEHYEQAFGDISLQQLTATAAPAPVTQ